MIVSLSQDGSEEGTAYVYEVATGKRLPDVITGVTYPTAGGSAEWAADGRGFWYTRYPQSDERPADDRHFFQQVWFHTLGAPRATDRYVIGKEFPRIAETSLAGSRDGRYLLAIVRNGDGGDIAFHLRGPDGRWTAVAGFGDGVKQAAFGDDGNLYAMTIRDAPLGQIIAMPLAKPAVAVLVVFNALAVWNDEIEAELQAVMDAVGFRALNDVAEPLRRAHVPVLEIAGERVQVADERRRQRLQTEHDYRREQQEGDLHQHLQDGRDVGRVTNRLWSFRNLRIFSIMSRSESRGSAWTYAPKAAHTRPSQSIFKICPS